MNDEWYGVMESSPPNEAFASKSILTSRKIEVIISTQKITGLPQDGGKLCTGIANEDRWSRKDLGRVSRHFLSPGRGKVGHFPQCRIDVYHLSQAML